MQQTLWYHKEYPVCSRNEPLYCARVTIHQLSHCSVADALASPELTGVCLQ